MVKDVAQSQISILEVNFTPDYLNDVLSLRDTWLAFVIILAILAILILMILIALRQRLQVLPWLVVVGQDGYGAKISA